MQRPRTQISYNITGLLVKHSSSVVYITSLIIGMSAYVTGFRLYLRVSGSTYRFPALPTGAHGSRSADTDLVRLDPRGTDPDLRIRFLCRI